MTVQIRSFGSGLAVALVAAVPAGAHEAGTGSLGEVDFAISCVEAAYAPFEQGLLLLHHMMYRQAEHAFQEAAAADPGCAMPQWGIAMSNFHPLWPGQPTPGEAANGQAAAERLAALVPGTDREAAYVDAVTAFYRGADTPYPQRLASWAAAQRTIDEAYPEDVDALAFDALARLAVAPRGAGATDELIAAGAQLADALPRAPLHPGLYHYAIHAYDHPALADRGLSFAQGYDRIAPEVAHALHMPSHIFTRLGHWEASAEWNDRSAAAALAARGDGPIPNHYAHAMDYGIYARLQLGRAAEAEAMLDELIAAGPIQDDFGSAYALAAAPARLALEQEDWARAAALPADLPPWITWERYPQTVAIVWFAKGIGAARTGDTDAARSAMGELGALRIALREQDAQYWLTLLEAQYQAIAAWMSLDMGVQSNAVELARSAALLEDSVAKSPVTPSTVIPARELLGDMMLELGRPAEAAAAYEAALAISPNRRRSVDGLERARDAVGR
jgi:hypothetical protein